VFKYNIKIKYNKKIVVFDEVYIVFYFILVS
jgi:hypothetical protein